MMTAEIFFVLPLQGVAGRAQSKRKNLLAPTGTADRTLTRLFLHRLHDHNAPGFNSQNLNHPAVCLEQCSIIAAHGESRIKIANSGTGRTILSMVDFDTLNIVPSSCLEYWIAIPQRERILFIWSFASFGVFAPPQPPASSSRSQPRHSPLSDQFPFKLSQR